MHSSRFRLLTIAGIFVASLVGIVLTARFISADTLFFDSFGTSSGNNVDGWIEYESSTTRARVTTTDTRAGSPEAAHVVLWGGGSISKPISTVGFKDIQLSYYWLGDISATQSDTLEVRWRVADQATTTVASHVLTPPINWSTQQAVALGAAAENTAIEINFLGNTSNSNVEAHLDDVALSGTPFGTVTIEKISVPANDIQPFEFTLSGSDPRITQVSDAGGSVILDQVTTGTYILTENEQTGWDFTSLNCTGAASGFIQDGASVTFTLAQGEQVSCSFTNTKRGSITVTKDVLSYSHTINPTDDITPFTIRLDNGSAIDQRQVIEGTPVVYQNLNPGSYALTEVLPTGYTFNLFSQDNDQEPSNGAQLTVNPGEDIQLLITNTQLPGVIAVNKNVFASDGTTNVTDPHPFSVTLHGDNGHEVSGTVIEGQGTLFSVDPYVYYTVTETLDAAYTFVGCDAEHPTCRGWSTYTSQANVVLINNQTNGSIEVIKNVLNPDGGEVSDSQTFTVSMNGDQRTIAENQSGIYGNLAPGTYTIEEINIPSGYAIDAFSIDEDAQTPGAQITLTSGEAVSLTVSNKQKTGTITVQKNVISFEGVNIGDDTPSTATVTGHPNQQFSENSPAVFNVNPGTYTVGELDHPSYDLESILPNAVVTVLPNGAEIVTITNRQSSATITVKKIVQDPNGQTTDDDTPFTATVTGQPPQSFSQNTDAVFTVGPGTYTIGELDAPGYDLVSIAPSQVTLNSGNTITVTITNRQRTGTIIVNKNVLNPDGGDVADGTQFPVSTSDGQSGVVTELVQLTLTGVTPRVPVTVSEGAVPNYDGALPQTVTLAPGGTTTPPIIFINKQHKATVTVLKDVKNPLGQETADNHQFTANICGQQVSIAENTIGIVQVNPGTCPVEELPDPDYDQDPNNPTSITVASGEEISITFVNRQKRGKIIVIKNVTNPDGGEAADTTSFTIRLDGENSQPVAEGSPVTYENLLPGTYTISEDPHAGYDAGIFSPSASVTVGSNGTATTTVTNRQHFATIIVHKEIVGPDGDPSVEDPHTFTASVDTDPINRPISEGNPATFTAYPGLRTVTEQPNSNYELVDITPSALVTVAPDQTVDVTITNKPKLVMIKINKIIQDVDGIATSDTHVFYVTVGNETKPLEQSTTTVFLLPAGTYTITETDDAGYSVISGSPQTVQLSAGQSTTKTITNRQVPGKIIVIKDVIGPQGEDVHDPTPFQIQFNGGDDQPIAESATTTFDTLAPGTYTLTETQEQGYDAGEFSTTTPIIIDPGEEITVIITNRQQAGSISGFKWDDYNGDSIKDEGEPGIPDLTIALGRMSDPETPESPIPIEIVALSLTGVNGAFTIPQVVPGSYLLFEEQRNGWETTAPWHVDSFFDITYRIDLLPQQKPLVTDSFFDVFVPSGESVSGGMPSGCQPAALMGSCGFVPLEFGNFHLGSIAGMKWNDLNGDGIKDENEPGLAGWTITLNPGNAATTTDVNGNYSYTGLSAGTYTIAETVQTGWQQTFPAGPGTHNIQIVSGTVETGKNFGNRLMLGRIIIEKQTLPDGDPQQFEFTGHPAGTIGDNGTISEDVEPGQNISTESIPEHWLIESIVCTDTDSVGDPQTGTITFNVAPGEEVRCVVTNKKAAHITITKTSIGGVGVFPFTGDLGAFSIETTQADTPSSTSFDVFVPITGQTIIVTETVPDGWSTSQQSCVLENVMPGGTQQCTFTNTKRGKIIVDKVTNPSGDPTSFTFTPSWGDPFTLTDIDPPHDSGYLAPGAYSVAEIVPSGWNLTSAICDDGSNPNAIDLAAGETVTCIFTNTKRGKITVIKQVTNDHGGTLQSPDFTIHVKDAQNIEVAGSPAQGSATGTEYLLVPGIYAVSEDAPPAGYALEGVICTNNENLSSIDLTAGEQVTCTITNDDKEATITVIKQVTNDSGGVKQVADFPLFIDGNPIISSSTVPVLPGNHIVSETNQSGYIAAINGDCDAQGNVTIALGEHKICIITNDDQQATITVVKKVINDNGGTKQVADFPLFIDSNPTISSTTVPVLPGAHLITETSQPGYAASFSGDCDAQGNVSVALGDNKVCTITNDDVAPTLTLIKIVINDDGGTKLAPDFPLFINDQPVMSGVTTTLLANVLYTASETPDAQYSTSTWSGDCTSDGTVTLQPGEVKACTITNDDKPATLIVKKHVTNDSGGDTIASDFTMNITGTDVSIPSFPGDEQGTLVTLDAGAYSVDEIGLPGYTKIIGDNCSGTIGNGEQRTCTITNDDQQATITVTKHVINDNGGIKLVSDFPLFIDGNPIISSSTVPVLPGNHIVSETNQSGYTAAINGDCDAQGNVTIALGEHKLCVITNNDQEASVTVVKNVVNDNGGTASTTDFTLYVGQMQAGNGIPLTVNAGTYAISENGPAGYTASYSGECVAGGWDITGAWSLTLNVGAAPYIHSMTVSSFNPSTGAFSGTGFWTANPAYTWNVTGTVSGNTISYHVVYTGINAGYSFDATGMIAADGLAMSGAWDGGTWTANGSATILPPFVALAPGENKTCTITNDDQHATLTVNKVVQNNYGGLLTPQDFVLRINGSQVSNGTPNTLNAGSYTVSEDQVFGYLGAISGDCATDGTITLNPGDHKTCTITNNDQSATITVVKEVINDNGGIKLVSDFPLLLDTTPVTSSSTTDVVPGTHAVSETNQSGYTATFSGDCDAQGNVSVALGEHKVCSITNNDAQGTLHVEKILPNDNGGTATSTQFFFSVNGGEPIQFEADGMNDVTVDAGEYGVVEANPLSGYAVSYQNCENVTVSNGGAATCIITNNDQQATITVIKQIVNNNGGNASTTGFALFVGETQVGNGDPLEIDPGDYTARETGPDGYTPIFTGDCDTNGNITIALGEHKVCTITNDDIAPSVSLIKEVINDNGGNAEPGDFDLLLGGVEAGSGVTTTVDANMSIEINEQSPAGYSFISITGDAKCPAVLGGTVMLDEEEHLTCTITNNDQEATITVVKIVINDNGGTKQVADFPLFIDGNATTSSTTVPVLPGAHLITETSQSGYAASFSGDCDAQGNMSVALGEHKVCIITNDDQPAQVTVEKVVINDNGGSKQISDFPLFLDGMPVISGTPTSTDAGTHRVTEFSLPGYVRSFSGACTQEGWDLNGMWDLDFVLSGDSSHRYHTMHVTSFDSNTGAFTGTGATTGAVPPPAPILYTWTVTGMETGNAITMTIAYNEIPGYAVSITGTLDSLGQMSGAFADSGSATGTFTGTGTPEPMAGSITVSVGESATCTITNNDEPATLKVEKTVLNTHGGTLNADAFTLRINGNVVPRGAAQALTPGTYTVSEDTLVGYVGTISGDCAADGSVTLNLGDHKTCTITNNDQPTSLAVLKLVTNNNGGIASTTDFILRIDGNAVTSGDPNVVAPGPHTVSEDPFTGYAGTIGGDCAADGTITLNLGDHKTCTITNDDQGATITVVKKVINDNGGTKQVSDFPLFIDGNPTTSSTTVAVLPGPHTVTETGQLGYGATFSGDCDGDGHMTIALGEHKKCTITNNDGQAQLTMVKQVVNDNFGSAQPSDFSFMAGATPIAHNQTITIDAGTYAITEQGPLGYAASFSAECANGSITLAPGDQKTCTVTNDDIPVFGEIRGAKWDDLNQNGVRDAGEPGLQGWTITLNPGSRATTTNESGNYRFVQVTPGAYTITESVPAGWTQTFPGGAGTQAATITLAGETVTGKDFGNFKYGTLSGYKYEDMNANGTRDAGEPGLQGWIITLNPGGYATTTNENGFYQFTQLDAGTYTISETPQSPLWHQSEPVSGSYAVAVASGTNEMHNFGNYRLGSLSGVKFEDVNGNSVKNTGEPLLAGWTITLLKGTTTVATTLTGANGAYVFNNLVPGAYEVRETLKSGWVQTLPQQGAPYAVNVVSGTPTVSVDFGNFRVATLNGVKYNDRNNNRRKDIGETGLSGWTIILVNLSTGEQRSAVTGAGGAYQFTNLGPGRYLVREVLKAGWLPTSPANGVYNSVDVFVSGGTVTRHFGNRQLTLPTRR